jgi:hypothetical protein
MKKFLAALGIISSIAFVASDLMAANPANILVRVTPVGTRDITLSTGTLDLGSVAIGGSTVSVSGVGIENSGNISQSYRLNIDTAGGTGTTWTPAAAAGADQFALFALFNGGTQPVPGAFGAEDIVLAGTTDSTATVYSNGVESGLNVSPAAASDDRTLWLRMDMPTSSTSTNLEEQFHVVVTAF